MFEIFKCSGQNSSKYSCQSWNDKSIPLPILHRFSLPWQITSLYIVSSYIFWLWTKKFHLSPNFETFKCSGENFPDCLCYFWKPKSVFLQILHQSSVPSNITPLYFFSLNIIYFGQRQPSKAQIFEIFECSDQNSSNSSYQFLHHPSLSWHITHL